MPLLLKYITQLFIFSTTVIHEEYLMRKIKVYFVIAFTVGFGMLWGKNEISAPKGENMSKYTQVICTSSRIKDGCLDKVRSWLHTLEQERRSETCESFQNEGVSIEAAFVKEENGSYFLVYFMRADDVQQAITVFQNSELSIDAFHKQCWEDFTEDHKILTPIFHLELD